MEVLEEEDGGTVGGDPLEIGPPGGKEALTPTRRRRLDGEQGQERGLDPAALAIVGHPVATDSAIFRRVVGSSSVASRPARPRTISPRAQNVMPSPYAGERPTFQ